MSSRSKRGPQLVSSHPATRATPDSPRHPFDLRYSTDTSGLIPAAELRTGHPADRHVTAYYGVAPSILRALIQRWWQETSPARSIEEFTFLDVGAGKGRALLIAAENPFREVVGIELNPTLAANARSNIAAAERARDSAPQATLAPLSAIRVVEGDALSFALEPVPTLAFLFHPFERAALRTFLRNVERTFAPYPGLFDLLYVNAEHLSLLRRNPALTLIWEGSVPMSTEDHAADLQEIAAQLEYGSTGDEHCAILRYVGRSPEPRAI